MRISHVKIQNFRSLEDIDVDVGEDYLTLIGKNDCGKSSFLYALRFLFDPEIRFVTEDVCAFKKDGAENLIQATISDCWHPESQGGDLKVQRVFDEHGSDRLYREGPVPRIEILKDMSQGVGTRKRLDEDTSLGPAVKEFAQKAIRQICEKGVVSADSWITLFDRLCENNLVEFENGWHVFGNSELDSLVKVIFLPADVRGEEEIGTDSRSTFQKIGQFILGGAEELFPDLKKAKDALDEQLEKISERSPDGTWSVERLNKFENALREEIARFDPDVAAQPLIEPPQIPPLNFKLDLDVRDNWVDKLARMGHGMRRSIVFAMLRANRRLVDAEEPPQGTNHPLFLFLIEEPEIYLHPQAERRRMTQLKGLSEDADAQVMLCTHSAIFVNLSDYRGILRLQRPGRRHTMIAGWQAGDLAPSGRKTLSLIHRFDPAKAAMLFADLVILVEGQCESDAIPFLAENLNLTSVDVEVEVVDCHGNENIVVFQRVLEGFGIKYVAWPDSDVTAVVADIVATRTAGLGKIVLTDHDWETMNGLPQGNKTFTSWKHFVFDNNPPNLPLETRIRAAYAWSDFP